MGAFGGGSGDRAAHGQPATNRSRPGALQHHEESKGGAQSAKEELSEEEQSRGSGLSECLLIKKSQ